MLTGMNFQSCEFTFYTPQTLPKPAEDYIQHQEALLRFHKAICAACGEENVNRQITDDAIAYTITGPALLRENLPVETAELAAQYGLGGKFKEAPHCR